MPFWGFGPHKNKTIAFGIVKALYFALNNMNNPHSDPIATILSLIANLPSSPFDRLHRIVDVACELFQDLAPGLKIKKATLLRKFTGQVYSIQLRPTTSILEPADDEEIDLWGACVLFSNDEVSQMWNSEIGHSVSVKEHLIKLVIPREAPDALQPAIPLGLLVLESDGDGTELLHQKTFLRIATHLLSQQVAEIDRHHLLDANQHLASVQARVIATSDMCYRISKTIRRVMHYDGFSVIAAWNRKFKTLEIRSHLGSRLSDKSSELSTLPALERDTPILMRVSLDLFQSREIEALVVESSGTTRAVIKDPEGARFQPLEEHPFRTEVRLILDALTSSPFDYGLSRVVVPLVWRNDVLGLAVLCSHASEAFLASEVLTLCNLLHFAIPCLIRDLRVETELETLDESSLMDTSVPLSHNIGLRHLLLSVCRRLRYHRGADYVAIVPYNPRQGGFDFASSGLVGSASESDVIDPVSINPLVSAVLNQGILEWHKAPQDVPTAPKYIELSSLIASKSIRACFGIRLEIERLDIDGRPAREPVGVLLVLFRGRRGAPGHPVLADRDKEWIKRYAHIVEGFLLANQDSSMRSKTLKAILELHQKLAEGLADDPLNLIFRYAKDLVGATAGIAAIPSRDDHTLDIVWSEGTEEDKRGARIRFGEGVTGACAEQRRPMDRSEPGVQFLPWVVGSQSELAVPLLIDGSLFGVINVENQNTRTAFGRIELATLESLAKAATLTIRLRNKLRELKSVSKVSKDIRDAASDDDLFERILDEAMDNTDLLACNARIALPNHDFLRSICQRGPVGRFSRSFIAVGEGTSGWAFFMRSICHIQDTLDARELAKHPNLRLLDSPAGTRSEVSIPLDLKGDRIGVLTFQHAHPSGIAPYMQYLEALAMQLTYDLWQRRRREFERAEKDVEFVNSQRSIMSYVIHDLLQPLDRALKMLDHPEVVMSQGLVDKMRNLLRDTENRGRKFVDWLPQLSGDDELVDCVTILNAASATFRESLGSTVINIHIECPLEECVVFAKASLLRWCFERILENSIREEASQINVVVRKHGEYEEGRLIIEFCDNAGGVSDATLVELYTFKTKPSTPNKGLGMGLPSARVYLGSMRGKIRSENRTWNPGSGESRGLATIIDLPLAWSVVHGQ